MPRWVGLLGSWALLILGLAVTGVAAAGQWINIRDARRFERLASIDALIAKKYAGKLQELEQARRTSESNVGALESKVEGTARSIEEMADSDQTILVSTAENRVYVKRGDETVFNAICSTGKGTTLIDNGRTMVFQTPIGKFKVISKEENPVWVPPDWHYIEEARKKGKRVVHLRPGQTLDVGSGSASSVSKGGGVWDWFDDSGGRKLKVRNNTVVMVENGSERELPAGEMIEVGGMVVIPPVGTPQRKFDKVLGAYRLNLGDGYALHGTQQTAQLGRSVSHGCVRLGDADIARLYQMANVGDEVIIY
jgi:hypothetical protein